jgi:AraC-like DNA-binding protein
MSGCGTVTVTNPDDCLVNVPGVSVNVVVTGRGEFRARVTWVNFRRMRLLRCRDNVPHIAFVALAPGRIFVAFPTHHDPAPIWNGVKLGPRDIVLHGLGERIYQRTGAASRWGFISLAPSDLAASCRALAGIDLIIPDAAKILRPSAVAASSLLRLHGKACRLAETRPDMIAHREVARALEQELVHALVTCLTADETRTLASASRRHTDVMARFEDILASHDDQQLSTAKLCAAIGVQQRTLRACCAEFIGMSPGDYVRLRRLNLVRAALRRADPETTSIAAVARRYGFSALGRFTALYQTAFGEEPSITLGGYSKIRHVVRPYVRKRRQHVASGLVPARTVARQRARADDLS